MTSREIYGNISDITTEPHDSVDASGQATFVSGSNTIEDGGTYTQEGVTVGTYTIDAASLQAKNIKVTSDYGLSDITASDITVVDGVSSVNFANGVGVTLASDTKTVANVTGGEFDSETGKITVNGISYTFAVSGNSGTLTADASVYNVDLSGTDTAVTGSDVASYTAKTANVTLNYNIAAHDSKSTDTLTAQLTTGEGYTIVDAAAGTFQLTGNTDITYTATTKVDAAALTLSGEVLTPGGATTSETFKATSGTQVATFGSALNNQSINLITTDGSAWSIADSDTTYITADGLDTLTVSYANGVVTAAQAHGLTYSDTAEFKAAVTPGAGETSTISAVEVSPASVDALGTDTLTFKVTTLNSADTADYTVTTIYNSSSEVTSAKLGDMTLPIDGTSTDVTLNGKLYTIDFSKDAMKDGDLTADDVKVTINEGMALHDSVSGTTSDYVDVSEAGDLTFVTYRYSDNAYYAVAIDGTTNKISPPTATQSVTLANGSTINWTKNIYSYFSEDGENWSIGGGSLNPDSDTLTITAGAASIAGALKISYQVDVTSLGAKTGNKAYNIIPTRAQTFSGASVTTVFDATTPVGIVGRTGSSTFQISTSENGNNKIINASGSELTMNFGAGVTGASETFSLSIGNFVNLTNETTDSKAAKSAQGQSGLSTNAWYANIDIGADNDGNGTIDSDEHFVFNYVDMKNLLTSSSIGTQGGLATVKADDGTVGAITSAFGSGAGGLTFYTNTTFGASPSAVTLGAGAQTFTFATDGSTITINQGTGASSSFSTSGFSLTLGTDLKAGFAGLFGTGTFGTGAFSDITNSFGSTAAGLTGALSTTATNLNLMSTLTWGTGSGNGTTALSTAALVSKWNLTSAQISGLLGSDITSTTALGSSLIAKDVKSGDALMSFNLAGNKYYALGINGMITKALGTAVTGLFNAKGGTLGTTAGSGMWLDNSAQAIMVGYASGTQQFGTLNFGTDANKKFTGTMSLSTGVTGQIVMTSAGEMANVKSFYSDLAVPVTVASFNQDVNSVDTFNNLNGAAVTGYSNYTDYVNARNKAGGIEYQSVEGKGTYLGYIDLKAASLSSDELYASYTYDSVNGAVFGGIYTNTDLTSIATVSGGGYTDSSITVGGSTYVLSAESYSDITLARAGASLAADAYSTVAGTAPTVAKNAEYAFSDSTVSFTISEAGVITAGKLANGSDVTVVDGTATWSDSSYAYSAVFKDGGTAGIDASDTVLVTKTSTADVATPAHYEGTVTLGGSVYTAKTTDSSTTSAITLYDSTGSETTVAGYTVQLNDNGTAADTSDDFFTWYSSEAFSDTAVLGAATVNGALSTTSTVTISKTWTGSDTSTATFSINGTANEYTDPTTGTKYTLVDVATGTFQVVTGAAGTSETMTVDTTGITRTISASIAGTAVSIVESGTSLTALTLNSVSGDGVTYANGVATIGGIAYAIAGSNSSYTATGDASSFNQSSDITSTATTYTFTAGEQSYTLAVGTDGKVYNYADGAYGTEQSDITVVGDITYTFSYDASDNSANVIGTYGQTQTYTTKSALNSTEIGSVTIDGVTFLTDDLDSTFTTTFNGKTYSNFAVDADTVTYEVATAATIYGKTEGEEVQAFTLSDGTILTSETEGTYTATWTDSEGQTMTTVGSIAAIIEAIGTVEGEVSVTLVQSLSGSAAADGTASASFLTDTNTQTTYAITNNEATVADGTVLTFVGEGGTFTSASASDGREVVLSGDSLVLAGKEDAVLATKNEDGSWTIAEGVDNVTNSTDEPLVFTTADGDTGTLASGASYNPETNELTNAGEGSLVKNEDGYASSNGDITGVESASYDDEGNLVLEGVQEGATVDGQELPVTGDADGYNATLDGSNNVKAVDDVSDGATVDISKVDSIGADDGATLTLTGDGTANVNGEDISVSGDEDGVKVTADADGIASVADLDSGATASVPAGTPVATDGSGDFTVNGQKMSVEGDADGVTLTPNEDGTFAVDGLNGTSEGDAFLTSDTPMTVSVGDDTYAVNEDSSLKADASGNASRYNSDDKSVDDAIKELGDDYANLPTLNADDFVDTETGIVDLSDQPAAIVRDDSDEDGTYILPTVGGSLVQIDKDASGEKKITASDNGDAMINNSEDAEVTMTGGAGADYIKTADDDDVVDVSAGGKDTLDVLENGASVVGYDPLADDAPAFKADADDQSSFMDQLLSGSPELTDNKIGDNVSLNDLDATDDRTLARFVTEDGEENLYAWTGEDGGTLDLTDLDEPAVAVGNVAGDHDGSEINARDSKADTILAGGGDVVKAGRGDLVKLSHNDSAEGADIEADTTASAADFTVDGFKGGFSENNADRIRANRSDFTFHHRNGLLEMVFGAIRMALKGLSGQNGFIEKADDEVTATSDSASVDYSNPDSGILEFKGTDLDGNNEGKYVLISDGQEYSVPGSASEITDFNFYGESVSSSASSNGTSVNFGNVSDEVTVDLGANIMTDSYAFNNIQNVKGGAGNTNIVGADGSSNGLYAGTGNNTIWSAAGNDTLYGNTSSEKQESTFVFVENTGNDTIKSFNYGSSETADKLDFMGADLSGADIDSKGNLKVGLTNGDTLTVEDANNEVIKAQFFGNEMKVELGDNLTYDSNVAIFGALNGGNKLTASGSDDVEIYMNNLDGKGVLYNDITEVNASSVTGNVKIAGHNDSNDTIRGGSGASSLWGGFGGDDQLVGGSGTNTFFYLVGDGNDTITNAKDGDVVELLGVNIDDIDLSGTVENSSNSAIEVKFNNGESLKVTGSGLSGVGFKVNGETWKRNSTEGWKRS